MTDINFQMFINEENRLYCELCETLLADYEIFLGENGKNTLVCNHCRPIPQTL
jgi:hypothetical protein